MYVPSSTPSLLIVTGPGPLGLSNRKWRSRTTRLEPGPNQAHGYCATGWVAVEARRAYVRMLAWPVEYKIGSAISMAHMVLSF